MNIEQENYNYIKSQISGWNENLDGSGTRININYDLIESVLRHRAEFGITSKEDLDKHHEATKKYIRTVTI